MTRQKRRTCFYCKYEISKYNKSNKCVKFNSKYKEICKNCTQRAHKPLKKPLYSDFDIQCKICKHPVMYKKCLPCALCNHFYHGKCLNLNKDDITKIEEIYNSYICSLCGPEILPVNFHNEIPTRSLPNINKKDKCNYLQCLTCSNSIAKKETYPNKHILYDGKKESLCSDCSKLGLLVPVKDKSLIEFQDCSLCRKLVRYESIFCNACQHIVHPYCNGIDKDELKYLSEMPDQWYCLACNLKIYPNNLIISSANNVLNDQIACNKNMFKTEYKTRTDCRVCNKKVTGYETLACDSCHHWIHKKCIGNFKNRTEYQNFLHYYSSKQWECPICTAEKLPFILLEDNEFFMLLLDLYEKPTYIDKNNYQQVFMRLKNDNFFNLTTNYESTENKYLNEIDPDSNYYASDTCEYTVTTDDIKVKVPHDLALMTFNIRSLKKNFKNFTQMLSRINSKIHIICLTESWLSSLDNIKDFEIDGYHTPLYQNRIGNSHGGGVVTYIHKDISKYKHLKHFSFVDSFNHCLATEITITNKSTTILNIYRSPNNLNDTFLDKFNNTVAKVNSRTCYILGDMNYNLINIDKHNETADYYNNLMSESFKPLIWKPTRITETNCSLIDHIWTNELRHSTHMKSHIIVTDISDHLPCITVVTNPEVNLTGYKMVKYRSFNDENRENFNKRINDVKDILSFHANNPINTNIESKFNDYIDNITRIYNECFPVITKKVHMKSFSKPWLTPQVQKLIDKKNKLFCIKKGNNTKLNRQKYKVAKITMEDTIDSEKSKYYRKLLDTANNNVKQKWCAIRQMINRRKVKENICTIPNDILGKHYETVAPNLAKKLPKLSRDDIPSTSKVGSKHKAKTTPQFEFNLTSDREIYEVILKLNVNKGPGIDTLDVKSIKSIAHVISPHLALLFNQCINEGLYPQCLKISNCIPVFKGSPLDPSCAVNYRPISILTVIDKTFERILHDQLSRYLEDHKLLPDFQYGYRKNHNTSQAILDFTEYINEQCSKKQITIAVFMDLSKAFDTVDKSILEYKLNELGLGKYSSLLINSYMSSRQFCMNSDKTKYYNLTYGVPQGSILGPLLFIMYTHDMSKIAPENKVIVYADDTTVLISGRNLTEAKQYCNDILTRFEQYFTLNKLSINASKTKYMIYKPPFRSRKFRKFLYDTTNTKIKMDDMLLEQVLSIRFLGVVINDKLTWNDHKKHICHKVCKSLGLLYKCRDTMTEYECINMYKTFIQPYFLYAIEVWGHTVQSLKDMISHLQSKVLRITMNCKRSDDAWRHCNGRILSIEQLYQLAIKKLCFKQHMEILPSYFMQTNMPVINSYQLQNRITRISLQHMYNYETTTAESCFRRSCRQIWNSLPFEAKSLPYLEKNCAYRKFSTFIKAL